MLLTILSTACDLLSFHFRFSGSVFFPEPQRSPKEHLEGDCCGKWLDIILCPHAYTHTVHWIVWCVKVHSWRTVYKKATVSVKPGACAVGVNQSYMWHANAGCVAGCYTPATVQFFQAAATAQPPTERRVLLVSCVAVPLCELYGKYLLSS